MAKKKNQKQGRPASTAPPKGGKKGGIGSAVGMLVMGVPMVILFLPTVVLLLFAMLPTVVAYLVERGSYRYGFICVGGFNFAGTSPYLLNMWFERHDITMALDILSDVFALVLIYGAAGFGWMLYAVTPSLVGAFLSLTSSRRIANLRNEQRKLILEWGPEVMEGSDGAEDDEVTRNETKEPGPAAAVARS